MRFKIKTLLILTALVGLIAGYYVSVWSQVSAERRAFEKLREHGFEVSAKYYPIKSNWSWRSVRQTIEWPWHRWSGTNPPVCGGFHLSRKKPQVANASERPSLASLDSATELLQVFSQLEWITFHYPVSKEEIELLKCLPYLEDVDFSETDAGNVTNVPVTAELVDSLLELNHLKYVTFGELQISQDSFDRLLDAGVEVFHYGIRDRQLEDDYANVNGICYQVDAEKSELKASLFANDPAQYRSSYRLELETRPDRYTEDMEIAISCDVDELSGSWNELVGQELRLSPKQPTMGDNYLRDQAYNMFDVINMAYQVVSRKENSVRLKASFDFERDMSVSLDTNVQLAELNLFLHADHAIEDAERILKESGFDSADFGAPIYKKEYHLLTFSTSVVEKTDPK